MWNGAIDDTWLHVMLKLVSMASNDQKHYVAHYFNCLDLMYTVVLLTMPLASHAADASGNSVKWLKKSSASHLVILN